MDSIAISYTAKSCQQYCREFMGGFLFLSIISTLIEVMHGLASSSTLQVMTIIKGQNQKNSSHNWSWMNRNGLLCKTNPSSARWPKEHPALRWSTEQRWFYPRHCLHKYLQARSTYSTDESPKSSLVSIKRWSSTYNEWHYLLAGSIIPRRTSSRVNCSLLRGEHRFRDSFLNRLIHNGHLLPANYLRICENKNCENRQKDSLGNCDCWIQK